MKKYLFGLGAMLIGAGLMFVFTHTEVSSAESEAKTPERFVCSKGGTFKKTSLAIWHCETKTLDCAMFASGTSCVKKGIFK